MRNLLKFASIAFVFSLLFVGVDSVSAQSRSDIRRERREYRGNVRDARHDYRRDVREARRDYRRDTGRNVNRNWWVNRNRYNNNNHYNNGRYNNYGGYNNNNRRYRRNY